MITYMVCERGEFIKTESRAELPGAGARGAKSWLIGGQSFSS